MVCGCVHGRVCNGAEGFERMWKALGMEACLGIMIYVFSIKYAYTCCVFRYMSALVTSRSFHARLTIDVQSMYDHTYVLSRTYSRALCMCYGAQ